MTSQGVYGTKDNLPSTPTELLPVEAPQALPFLQTPIDRLNGSPIPLPTSNTPATPQQPPLRSITDRLTPPHAKGESLQGTRLRRCRATSDVNAMGKGQPIARRGDSGAAREEEHDAHKEVEIDPTPSLGEETRPVEHAEGSGIPHSLRTNCTSTEVQSEGNRIADRDSDAKGGGDQPFGTKAQRHPHSPGALSPSVRRYTWTPPPASDSNDAITWQQWTPENEDLNDHSTSGTSTSGITPIASSGSMAASRKGQSASSTHHTPYRHTPSAPSTPTSRRAVLSTPSSLSSPVTTPPSSRSNSLTRSGSPGETLGRPHTSSSPTAHSWCGIVEDDDDDGMALTLDSSHLMRCNSAYAAAGLHDGMVSEESEQLRRVSSMVMAWPSCVVERLQSPDILLQLALPECAVESDIKVRRDLRLRSGAAMIPHPDKELTGGADAFFISTGGIAVGVADGVGEWDSFGLNPRMFAEEMMEGCKATVEAWLADGEPSSGTSSPTGQPEVAWWETPPRSPSAQHIAVYGPPLPPASQVDEEHLKKRVVRLLELGHGQARSYGSATALIARLDSQSGLLSVANLGDSTLICLRREEVYTMKVVFRTIEQQHQFNCPFQLSNLPEQKDFHRLRSGGKHTLIEVLQKSHILPQDTPRDADTHTFQVKEGDLILLGTDGVFDNLFDHEIAAITNLALSPFEAWLLHDPNALTPASSVAIAIAEAAAFRSRDPWAKTPFMANARRNGTTYRGGKLDDITCVASWVTRASMFSDKDE
eukprot:GHVN01035495.1.p1 GENE.GHVN01035495.1~~GHVN01035495.1.p1  ORF type:complete len:762 (-),score=174.03 GHVN01035495.1:1859-4144(-)